MYILDEISKVFELMLRTCDGQETDWVIFLANSLAEYYVFYNGDTNLINKELDIYKSITKEEIRNVAQKYLNPNQRLELHYLPKVQKEEK